MEIKSTLYARPDWNFTFLMAMMFRADLWTGVEQASQRDTEWPWLQCKRRWKQTMLVEIPQHDQSGRVTVFKLQNPRSFPGLTCKNF